MNINNFGVQAGGNVNFHNSSVSFRTNAEQSDPKTECLRSLASGTTGVREDLPERTPKTGEWILIHQHYSSWLGHGGLLWIRGRPGCGKSMLMDFLLDTERQRNPANQTTVLSFFHPASEPSRAPDSAVNLFRSLCFQLLMAHESLLPHFMAHTNFANKRTAGFGCVWKAHELREWFFRAVSKVLPHGHSVVIFIDALNELSASAAVSTAEQLRSFAMDSVRSVRICVSCHSHLSDGSRIGQGDLVVHLQDENRSDLEAFVDSQFAPLREASDHQQLQMIKDELLRGSRGVFQWLKWSCQKAKMLVDAGESTPYIMQQMQKYPRELDDIYEQILASLDELEPALRLLECLALAGGTMRAADLRYAVCLDNRARYESVDEVSKSQQYCHTEKLVIRRAERLSRGLVHSFQVYVSELNPWRRMYQHYDSAVVHVLQFDHDSVKHFMLTKGLNALEARLGRPRLSELQRHTNMAKQLLAFLQADEVANFASSEQMVQDTEILGIRKVGFKQPHPEPALTHYAASHWYKHALAAEDDHATVHELSDHLLAMESRTWTHLARLHEIASLGYCSQFCLGSTLLHILSHCGLAKVLSQVIDDVEIGKSFNNTKPEWIEMKNNGGGTPLFIAANNGQFATTRALLRRGARVNTRNQQGLTPLHCIALHGNVDVGRLLLAQPDIDVDATDNNELTPFQTAVSSSSLPVVELLLSHTKQGIHSRGGKHTFNVTYLSDQWQASTPLAFALARGTHEVLKFLLDHFGGNDTAQERGADSLLHYISRLHYCSPEEPELRKDIGRRASLIMQSNIFDVNWRGQHGRTPLSSAAEWGAAPVARQILVQKDVRVNEVDDDGMSALMHAVRRKYEEPFVERDDLKAIILHLLDHEKIMPDKTDLEGSTPFLETVRSKHLPAAYMLAKSGKVDLNARDAAWTPAFHLAIDSDNITLVKLFLKAKGVDFRATDALGFTALMRAVRRGKSAIVLALAVQGAVVNRSIPRSSSIGDGLRKE